MCIYIYKKYKKRLYFTFKIINYELSLINMKMGNIYHSIY